ncbi:MAG TPA: UDP-N-acetylglucosamine 1-carboxyvinyltransferase, partial [Myxococcota bacterium]|nr:UDP-N-acetylglucosamine 1-carboxyvinyltransferase [Myxococcota bacterium]
MVGETGDRFLVEGGRPVGGTLVPSGNKNEALPALAATLLAPGACTLENVPDIRDVRTMLEILVELGVSAGPLAPGRGSCARPGGDRIGRRRIDTHLHALRLLGADVEVSERQYHLRLEGRFRGGDIFLDEASVMATENAVMAAAVADGRTRIANAASEPHV